MKHTLNLPRGLSEHLLARAAAQPEVEVCGLIGARFEHYPVTNRSPAPRRGFEMDISEQIAALRALRENDQPLLAIYHSHPVGTAAPSVRDRECIGYPDVFMLIIAPQAPTGRLRAWRRAGATWREATLRLLADRQIDETRGGSGYNNV